MTSKLYGPMGSITEAQGIVDTVIAALGADRIPGVDADVQAALSVASRLLREAHEAIDTIAVGCRV